MNDRTSMLWGGILVALGGLFLLNNWGVLGTLSSVFWAMLFFAGGASFLVTYRMDRSQWWAFIPGFTLLALGLLVSLGSSASAWGGSLFLGFIGLSFLAVYVTDVSRWWAVIPAGVLLTLALIASINQAGAGTMSGSVFFLGLAATFGFLYLAPHAGNHQAWALYPALALLLLAGLSLNLFGATFSFFFTLLLPLGLIAFGIYLLWQQRGSGTMRRGH